MAVFQRIRTSDKIRDSKTRKIIKSSAQRYRNVETGRIVSKRQRDKAVKAAKENPYTLKTYENRYNSLLRDYIAKQAQQGKASDVRKAQLSKDFTQLLRDLKKSEQLRAKGKNAEANDLIKKALEKTTRRDGIDPSVIIGESPK